MRIFRNIEECGYPQQEKEQITQIINDLIPLRKSLEATDEYCDKNLKGNCMEQGKKARCKSLRSKIFDLLRHDTDSKICFNYLYRWLAHYYNTDPFTKTIEYDVYEEEVIRYCIDHDFDEVKNELKSTDSDTDKLHILNEYLISSKENRYQGKEKERFESLVKDQLEMINSLKGKNEVLQKTEKLNDNINEETESRAKKYFKKAQEKGYIEETPTGYRNKFGSKALLAYFLECVFCKGDNGNDNGLKFPETYLNKLFNESRLGKAREQLVINKKNHGKPGGFEKVDELFK